MMCGVSNVKVYIDSECKCHTTNPDNTYRAFDVHLFYGKCKTFIEGHRYCPRDESYVREDGKSFRGECITVWKPYPELAAAQAQYEADLAVAAAAYQEGVNSAYDK